MTFTTGYSPALHMTWCPSTHTCIPAQKLLRYMHNSHSFPDKYPLPFLFRLLSSPFLLAILTSSVKPRIPPTILVSLPTSHSNRVISFCSSIISTTTHHISADCLLYPSGKIGNPSYLTGKLSRRFFVFDVLFPSLLVVFGDEVVLKFRVSCTSSLSLPSLLL